METQYVIEAELYDLNGILAGGDEFLRRFAVHRSGRTTTFVFSDEHMAAEAFAFLTKASLKAERFYSFRLRPNEVATYPAIYLGIEIIDGLLKNNRVNQTLMGDHDMAVDYQTERIVATVRVKELLEEKTHRLRWQALNNTGERELMFMDITERLPQPIIIPAPLFVGPNLEPPGTYAVRSDGREVINRENLSTLSEVGLALSEMVRAGSRLLRWRPRRIACGAVINALQDAGVRGVLEPSTPLIQETDPLASTAVP